MSEFTELEAELKRLRPRQVSTGLTTRVERALAGAPNSTPGAALLPKRRRSPINWFGLGLGLAAAATLLTLARVNVERTPGKKQTATAITATPVPGTVVPPNRDSFVPVGLTQVVYGTRDEGLHFPKGATQPIRRVRSQKRETLQWRNQSTGTSLRLSYPSEEVTFIPVSGQ